MLINVMLIKEKTCILVYMNEYFRALLSTRIGIKSLYIQYYTMIKEMKHTYFVNE